MRICMPWPMLLAAAIGAVDAPPANPAIDRELVRYQQAAAKLREQREESVAKEKARTIPVLAATARAAVKRGDMAAASATWREILVLDREQPDAVGYFTSLGQIDAVLAELDGDPLAPSAAPAATTAPVAVRTISARPAAEPDLTGIAAGTRLAFTYVDGDWTFKSDAAPGSPDAVADDRYRLAIFASAGERGGEWRMVGTVRPGTVGEPAVWTAPRAFDRLWLGIARQREPAGQVRYRLEVIAPEASP